jgi:hypothetical protein
LNTIRRSPITRATAWLVTAAMVAPCLLAGRVARAQTQQPLRVIIADIVNKSPGSPNLGVTATAAIYNEMVNSGQGRFSVFQNSEVLKEAQSLGIKVPSNPNMPANFSASDLQRIAKNLTADAVVEGQVGVGAARGKGVQVTLITNLREVASQQLINGGYSQITATPRPGESADSEELTNRGVADAAQDVVRQVLGRQIATGTVIGIETNTVILNKGIRDGVHVGDDVAILREGANGVKVQVGRVKVARAYPTDSEAEIVSNIGGIRPEDAARVLYVPPYTIINAGTNVHSTSRGAQFSLTAVGSTIAVIGLGVLVAQAARGGQTSTTSVTAEAGVQSGTPVVRVRWSDNIFGQGSVQQYKIYREPDFPFGQSSSGSNNGGTTTGGSPPIGVSSSTVHEFFDHGSPYFPYANGLSPLTGNGNGGLGSGNNNNNGGGNNGTTTGCGTLTVATTLDTGFRPGSSYHYLVTAIILRQVPTSSGGGSTNGGGNTNGGGGNTNGGGGNTNGGGSGSSGGTECIETDPSRSGQSTPINPVLLTSPANNTASVNVSQFTPQFTSRNGADVYQVEVSTDRTFSNPSLIARYQIISSAPNADGVAQTVQNPIDLTVSTELLRDTAFRTFVTDAGCQGTGTGVTAPSLYYRVGARHDGDTPGPIHAISQNPSDPDKTFRFVYSQVFSFIPAPLPPCPPGTSSRSAATLNRIYAGGNRAQFQVLKPGDTTRGAASLHSTVQTPQEILLGSRRKRN